MASLLDRLRNLPLDDLILTGAIAEDGTVLPVGGTPAKLGNEDVYHLLRHRDVLSLVPRENLEQARIWGGGESKLLPVVGVNSVAEAVEAIEAHTGPARALRRVQRASCETLNDVFGAGPGDDPEQGWRLYQPLPLLVEIEVPDRPPGVEKGEDGDEKRRVPTHAERMFNEEIARQTRTQMVRVAGDWDALFRDFRHRPREEVTRRPKPDYAVPTLILLAAPGGGKSTVLKHLVRSQGANDGRLPVRLTLAGLDWTTAPPGNHWHPAEALEFLRQNVGRQNGSDGLVPKERWQTWCERGRLLLLLDGLDELDASNAQRACGLINCLAQENTRRDADNGLPLIVTCRIADFVRHRAVLDNLPVFGLGILPDTARQAYIAAYPRLAPDERQDLRDMIQRHASLMQLAELPLGLALLCWLRAHEAFPEQLSRAWVYNRLLYRLLEEQRPDRPNWQWQLDAEERFKYLKRAAFALFSQGDERQVEFGKHQWLAAFPTNDCAKAEHLLEGARQTGLILCRMAVSSNGEPQAIYSFLHFTFAEHLTASALAAVINQHGWNKPLQLPGWETKTGEAWLDEIVRKPWWTEVLLRLSGQLNEKPLIRLIENLANPDKDNILLLRRCLAVRCGAEAKKPVQGRLEEVIRRAQDELMYFWGLMRKKPEVVIPPEFFAHCLWAAGAQPIQTQFLTRNPVSGGVAVLSAARLGALPVTDETIKALLAHLGGAPDWVQNSLPDILAVKGLITTPDVTEYLLTHNLWHASDPIRKSAADTLGALGSAAARPDVIKALLARLREDEDSSVRSSAASGLGGLGPSAATPDVIEALLARLREDEDSSVRSSAVKALRVLGPNANSALIEALLAKLRDERKWVRDLAASELGGLGTSAATPDVIEALLAHLKDKDTIVRYCVEILENLGPSVATPHVIKALLAQPRHEDWFGRAAVANSPDGRVLSTIQQDVIKVLLARLGDENRRGRWLNAKALGNMGSFAAMEHVIETLLGRMREDESYLVRSFAAKALCALDPNCVPAVIELIVSWLHETSDLFVLSEAARVLVSLGSRAAIPSVTDSLLGKLEDEDDDIRSVAAVALYELDPSTVTPPLKNTLIGFLRALRGRRSLAARELAPTLLGALGPSVAIPPVIEEVLARLGDKDPGIRHSATQALERLGAPYIL